MTDCPLRRAGGRGVAGSMEEEEGVEERRREGGDGSVLFLAKWEKCFERNSTTAQHLV